MNKEVIGKNVKLTHTQEFYLSDFEKIVFNSLTHLVSKVNSISETLKRIELRLEILEEISYPSKNGFKKKK